MSVKDIHSSAKFQNPVTIRDIEEAAHIIHQVGRVTPLLQSMFLSRNVTAGEVYLKLENMQLTGSFKFRGAFNKINHLTAAEKARGVIAASAGNHAQGVALTSQLLGIDAIVVMPHGAPLAKQQATAGYGAKVVLYGDNFDEAHQFMEEEAIRKGYTVVDPYDDVDVIAGQGTIGLEILDQLWDVDTVIVPVGGGGLISGIATALKSFNPQIHIVGVQSENIHGMTASYAADRIISFSQGKTLADGTAVATPGQITFPITEHLVDEMVLVSEEEIATAMKDLLQRTKTVVEGAGALPTAALEAHKIDSKWIKNKKVVALVSGGNVDLECVSQNLEHFVTLVK
ncbi:bifunctional threonine ammonia-lyase/L-serine ammonia-lyase TdcB [Companilactobacillus kimchiensis]|nr:bifunctional threonine ammonia-lyase/L-serine ammonia-lyase TdcB [Companilactobacillus kimchiensis]